MTAKLLALLALFSRLSLLAFGGGNTVVPEMKRVVVDTYHWMGSTDFFSLYALAQAAPGPNMMVVTLVGQQVAGTAGALVATLGLITPSSVLVIIVSSFWQRFRDAPWRRIAQAGIGPVSIGLICATAAVIVTTVDTDWVFIAITLVVAVVSMGRRVHPLWLLAGSAVVGILAG